MSHYARGKAGFKLGEHISRALIPRPMAVKRKSTRSYGRSRKRSRSSRLRTRSRRAVSTRRALRNSKRSFRRKRARASKKLSFGPRISMGDFIKWQKQNITWLTTHTYTLPNDFQICLNTISVDSTAPHDFFPAGTPGSVVIRSADNAGFTSTTVTGVNRVWLRAVTIRCQVAVYGTIIPRCGVMFQVVRLKNATSTAGTIHADPWSYNDTFRDYKVLRKKVIKLKQTDNSGTGVFRLVEFSWTFPYKKCI